MDMNTISTQTAGAREGAAIAPRAWMYAERVVLNKDGRTKAPPGWLPLFDQQALYEAADRARAEVGAQTAEVLTAAWKALPMDVRAACDGKPDPLLAAIRMLSCQLGQLRERAAAPARGSEPRREGGA